MTAFPFPLVGFDLDGTLLDTHEDLAAALNHALALAGRPPLAATVVRDLVGGGARRMLDAALARSGGTEGLDVDALHRALIAWYQGHIAVHTRLFDGGMAMLDALAARGVRLAVVTNKLESLARQLFEELGLASRFFAILGGDTLGPGRGKPKPDLLFEMLRRAGVPPAAAAYVGDTAYDTGAARAAGMACVVVRFGFNRGAADALGGDAVIGHFDELVPALERLGRGR
ncbi:MAG: HAD-IA family hydrolase [Sphingomonadales bacterium]|nr:HAD-IA family hydrolase [Sphingomonadales bacterium]